MPEEGGNEFLVGSDGSFSEGWRDSLPEDIRDSEVFEGVNNFSDLASGFAKSKTTTPQAPTGLIDNEGNFTDAWNEIINNEFEGNKSLQQLSNVKSLAKSYVNQGKIVGRKNFDFETASDEEKAEILSKMGVPEKAEDYGIEKPEDLPDGMSYSEEQAQAFMNKAHELKLTKDQISGLNDWYNGLQINAFNESNTALDELQAASQREIKEEFGAAYDSKIDLARRTVKTFGIGDTLEELGLEDNPAMVRMLVKVGEAISEDRLVGEGTNDPNALTPAEAQKEINELMNDKALFDPNHPQHKDKVARKTELFKMIHGNK